MIRGTNAYCKITKVSISDSTAIITLLIFATKSTMPAKSFRICIKDEDVSELEYADNNTYWVDQVHNYNFDSNNIDTKKHKEIMISIDISNKQTSAIKDNRWTRNCYIYLMESNADLSSIPAWSSELLSLVSDEFEIPSIKNISFDTVEHIDGAGKIKTKFSLEYTSEKDFNYNNSNFSAILNIRSVATDKILETKTISSSAVSLYNEIITTNSYEIFSHVVVQLLITDKNKHIVREERKIYKLTPKYSNGYIKTATGIKRIIAYFVNTDSDEEHEGEWL